jgi:hypothetical protein
VEIHPLTCRLLFMTLYSNRSGTSGIYAYETGEDFIKIRFVTDHENIYLYNEKLNGKKHIDRMKKLARQGSGLSTYIARHTEVRDHFIKSHV